MLEERSYISEFDIKPNGSINVRKTTEVLKDGQVISSSYWRCVLDPNDSQAESILNNDFYLTLAKEAWKILNK